ncbi:DUF4360 domain-containing protein [Pendulispora albinea]|uniref:DUF4360 domain-containing protein n=1 Tax=Pendulispora albinea TaxID=2741071 RepID=A0ABZ2MC00_9BACT
MKRRPRFGWFFLFAPSALLAFAGACTGSSAAPAPDAKLPADRDASEQARPDASPKVDAGTDARADASIEPPVTLIDSVGAAIGAITFAGALCEPATMAIARSNDRQRVTVTFSTAFSSAEAPASASCTITITMDVPAGYRMGPLRPKWLGEATRSRVSHVYWFEDGATTAPVTEEIAAAEYQYNDHPDLWSPVPPACTAPQRVRFSARIDATVHDAESAFYADSFELETSWRGGADWERGCDLRKPFRAPPGTVGDWCAGNQKRPCTPGLGCEFMLTAIAETQGQCVDPLERVPPSEVGQPCGGLRDIACAGDRVCWRRSQVAIDKGYLGLCREHEGAEGAACDLGVPSLPCRAGLYCATSLRHRCVEANGELGSICAPELPACKAGLECNAEHCRVPKGGQKARASRRERDRP